MDPSVLISACKCQDDADNLICCHYIHGECWVMMTEMCELRVFVCIEMRMFFYIFCMTVLMCIQLNVCGCIYTRSMMTLPPPNLQYLWPELPASVSSSENMFKVSPEIAGCGRRHKVMTWLIKYLVYSIIIYYCPQLEHTELHWSCPLDFINKVWTFCLIAATVCWQLASAL